jgi:hypothetical protein
MNKSLCHLKTSAARFYKLLAKSLVRLGFNKTKHEPDLWIVDESSHRIYLYIYVFDILICSKDTM